MSEEMQPVQPEEIIEIPEEEVEQMGKGDEE